MNTNTDSKPNWPWISLLLPGNNLENTWTFVSQEKWEPCKICMEVPGMWHKKTLKKTGIKVQKPWENLEFGIWKKVGTLKMHKYKNYYTIKKGLYN